VILLAPAAVLLGAWSFQDGEEKVTVKGQDVPLLTVFKAIKKQAGYNFFYAANFVNDRERVSVDMQNAKVDDVLRKVLGRDYVWVYNDNAVSITKKKVEVKRNDVPVAPVKDSSVNQITVSGSVTDAKGTPIPGATVMVKGTHDGASTDENGHFSLAGVRPNAVLVISSVGFEKREVPVKGKTILAKLNVSVNDLDEAVVVAYGETTQRANTGAVTVVRGEQIRDLPNRSFDRSLQGQVPGLLVTGGNGQPGGGLSNFVLRGIGTGVDAEFGSSVRHPLVVMDGVPVSTTPPILGLITSQDVPVNNPLATLNTNDIASISVLKDASAIALYGSRASNGVILITTKKGSSGKTAINFRHQTDVASGIKSKVATLNQSEYLELLYEAYKNSNPAVWNNAAIKSDLFKNFPHYIEEGDTVFYAADDWLNALINRSAVTISNDISLSGGNDKFRHYLNFGYITQEGVVKNTGFDRGALRYNFESRPVSFLKIGLNTSVAYSKQDYASISETAPNIIGLATLMSPLNPVRSKHGNYILLYPQGTPAFIPSPNPLAALEYNINRFTSYRGLSNFSADLSFLRHFRLNTNVGAEFLLTQWKEKLDPRLSNAALYIPAGIGRITDRDVTRVGYNITNTLNYIESFNERHTLSVLIGQEARSTTDRALGAISMSLRAPYYEEISSANVVTAYGNILKESLVSFFGQVNYDYRNKYFISASGRRDGSSKFGLNERYGNYWSIGAAWVLTEESFLKKSAKWMDYFKVRGSIGRAGNASSIDALTRFDQLALIDFNGSNAAIPAGLGNEYIQWEEALNLDLGIEASILQKRLSLTADLYKRNISKLVYPIAIPANSGYGSTVLSNIGDMQNQGMELSLNAELIRGEMFKWNFSINWSTNQNRLIKANQLIAPTGNLVNKEGENFNSFYLVRWAGVNPENGLPMWIDSTGKMTSDYAAAKPAIVGKPQPDGFGGIINTFFYKNIELSFLFYYQYGFEIYSEQLALASNDGLMPYVNQSRTALDRWRQPGDMAKNPRRVLNNTDGGSNPSTRFLFDGSYVRLKNVSLAYNFPKFLTQRWGINSLRIYLQGNNLALWTKFPGDDPENTSVSGSNSYAYPQQKTYTIGLNVNF